MSRRDQVAAQAMRFASDRFAEQRAGQDRRRDVRVFDADADGLSDSTLPLWAGRGGVAGGVWGRLGDIGTDHGAMHTFTGVNPSQSIPAAGGLLNLASFEPLFRQAGFSGQTMPNTVWTIPTSNAYWRLHVEFEWDTFTGGGTVEVRVNGSLKERVADVSGRVFWHVFALGVLNNGDAVTAWVVPDGAAGAQVANVARVTLELVQGGLPDFTDPPVGGPTVFATASANQSSGTLPVPKPAGMKVGDRWLVLFSGFSYLSFFGGNATLTVPAGFTPHYVEDFGVPLRLRHWVGSRVVTAADLDGTNVYEFHTTAGNSITVTSVGSRAATTVGTVVGESAYGHLALPPRVVTSAGPSIVFAVSATHRTGSFDPPSGWALVGTDAQAVYTGFGVAPVRHLIGSVPAGTAVGLDWTPGDDEQYHVVSIVTVEVT